MSNSFWDLPSQAIEKVIGMRKQIEALEASLAKLFGGTSKTAKSARRGRPPKAVPVVSGKVDGRKGKRSAATRAKMAAAAKARWAEKGKAVSTAPAVKGAKKKRRKMSPEARAKIAAAQKARWAKQKA